VTTALILVAAAVLGLAGLWGSLRLLGRLALDPMERLALALALYPAALGLAALAGLMVGWPGPLVPAVVAVVLVVAGCAGGGGPPPPPPPPPPQQERGSQAPASSERGLG
jgi:peptidoglycan/LPS O-acetylase OafA/YrhL